MISISEQEITGLINREVERQVKYRLDKYFKGKEFKDIVTQEVKHKINSWYNAEDIANNIVSKFGVEALTNSVSNVVFEKIIDRMREWD